MTVVSVPSSAACALLRPMFEDVTVLVWDMQDDPPEGFERIEFMVPGHWPSENAHCWFTAMPELRVVQLLSAGVDHWIGHVPSGVTLCSARGVHGRATAELALAGLLAVLRDIPTYATQQRMGVWERHSGQGLDTKRILVIGAGDIGGRFASACELFGAETTLVARRPREGVRDITELATLVPDHEVVMLAVPMTASTVGLINAEFLAAMPDGSVLVNVARGPIVDTDALVAELFTRRLRAFLDVMDPEPLPANHPLWSAPNLLLTPHVGGFTGRHDPTGWHARAEDLVTAQLRRYLNGRELMNVVAIESGY
jgi:phosphoglycerate dehydrogenase-like enzyme